MAYITNQWIKKNQLRKRGHYPIPVRVAAHEDKSEWDKSHSIALNLHFSQERETYYTHEKCGVVTIKLGELSDESPVCDGCGAQLSFTDVSHLSHKYQVVDLTQEDIGSIIGDLFLANSIASNRDFLTSIIPNISNEFKFELIKLLLNDNN